MFSSFRPCRKDEISFYIVAKKRQQCRSNIQICRKNRSTCSIRQGCFDIVAGVDEAYKHVRRWAGTVSYYVNTADHSV